MMVVEFFLRTSCVSSSYITPSDKRRAMILKRTVRFNLFKTRYLSACTALYASPAETIRPTKWRGLVILSQ